MITLPSVAELTQELIRFDTTNPPGNEAGCVAHLQRLLHDAGLQTVVAGASDSRPSLVARLTGRGEAPPLLLQGHVDVVTTAGQAWTRPPFAGVVVDGHVWERGAIDMKGGVAMMVLATLRFLGDGGPPPGDVVIAVLADEEAGGLEGAGWLAANRPDLFTGIRHALGEGGGFAWYVGGRRFYPLMVAEKRGCQTRAVFRGPGGHGSRPLRGGAMARLGRALVALDSHRMPVHISTATRLMLEGLRDGLPEAPLREQVGRLLDPAFEVIHRNRRRPCQRQHRDETRPPGSRHRGQPPPELGVAGSLGRAQPARVQPWLAAQGLDLQPAVVAERRQAGGGRGGHRLQGGVFGVGGAGLLHLPAPLLQVDARSRQQLAQLGQLARVAGGDYKPASARFW